MVFLIWFTMSGFAQIVFNGCHPLFENQDYTFNFISTDATGRNVYTTTPVDGAQTCGGIGTCEFMIAWNDIDAKWEFLADDGNGDFSAPYLIYSNTSASTPNPPGLTLGVWTENNPVTDGDCGGDLSTSNSVLTGDVQETTLGIGESELESQITIYPNPSNENINIKMNDIVEGLVIYDVRGKIVLSRYDNLDQINISGFHAGLYLIKIKFENHIVTKKIIIN